MKRIFLRNICLTLLFLGNFYVLGALEMELSAGVNLMTFHPDRVVAHSDSLSTSKEFSYYPMGIGIFRFSGDINEIMGFKISFERDNVLQSSINTVFSAKTDHFLLEFGPFVGICDTFDFPDAGIKGGFGFALPGIASISILGFTSLAAKQNFTSDNCREGLELSLRFWLPKMLLTATAGLKNLSLSTEEEYNTLVKDDTLVRYMLNADFFSKGSPVIVSLKGGYQIYSRIYSRGNTEIEDKLNSFFGGFELQIQASNSLKIKAGIEIPFLITAVEPMTVTPEFLNLSNFTAGFIYTFYGKP